MPGLDPLDLLEATVVDRRTSLRMDPEREVPQPLLERLLALVTWAPNHKRTEPWRFAVFTGDGRDLLGAAFEADSVVAGVTDPAKLAKARTKYRRAPAVVLVGCVADADATRHAEDRDAVAAGIQNLLLGAHAAGLASYWSTGAVVVAPSVKALAGLSGADVVVGVVYLGWPTGDVPVPARRPPLVRWVG